MTNKHNILNIWPRQTGKSTMLKNRFIELCNERIQNQSTAPIALCFRTNNDISVFKKETDIFRFTNFYGIQITFHNSSTLQDTYRGRSFNDATILIDEWFFFIKKAESYEAIRNIIKYNKNVNVEVWSSIKKKYDPHVIAVLREAKRKGINLSIPDEFKDDYLDFITDPDFRLNIITHDINLLSDRQLKLKTELPKDIFELEILNDIWIKDTPNLKLETNIVRDLNEK